MSQYAHLSKLDPEFAALLKKFNPSRQTLHRTPPFDIAASQKKWMEHSLVLYVGLEKRLHPGW